jgi:hypothetical protein
MGIQVDNEEMKIGKTTLGNFFDISGTPIEDIVTAMKMAVADGVVEERKSTCECGHPEYRQVTTNEAAAKVMERFIEAYPTLCIQGGQPLKPGMNVKISALAFLHFITTVPEIRPIDVVARTYLLLTKAPKETIH